MLKNQTCDLLSIHTQTLRPLKFTGIFILVFFLIYEQINVLYVEFESAEKYTHQLHVHFQWITLRGNCM